MVGARIFGLPLMPISNARLFIVMAFPVGIGNMSKIFPSDMARLLTPGIEVSDLSDTKKAMTTGKLGHTHDEERLGTADK